MCERNAFKARLIHGSGWSRSSRLCGCELLDLLQSAEVWPALVLMDSYDAKAAITPCFFVTKIFLSGLL